MRRMQIHASKIDTALNVEHNILHAFNVNGERCERVTKENHKNQWDSKLSTHRHIWIGSYFGWTISLKKYKFGKNEHFSRIIQLSNGQVLNQFTLYIWSE